MSTRVPAITFGPDGLHLPQEANILNGVLGDMNAALGGGMSTSLTSPQGQLAQSFTAIVGDKNDQIAKLVNQMDPDAAEGRYQDSLGRIYFMDRIPARGTLVTGTCTGLVGTVIPVGSIAQDARGYHYASLEDATIPASGAVDVDFQCLTMGPLDCPIGTLATIYKAVTGWESITNHAAGTPGSYEESRSDFEYRRRNSVAANAVNSIQAIRGAVLAVPGVLDAYVIDNSYDVPKTVGSTSYPMARNSVYIAVSGGKAEAVARAIWSKKSLGCGYNGNISYTITDTSAGVTPYPEYEVRWQTPTALPVYIAVNLAKLVVLPPSIMDAIKKAVLDAFNGADGGSRARIGSTLYAGRYYAGVAATDSNVEILSILIGDQPHPTGTSLAVGIDQRPTLDLANITVTMV